jgi:hypothetical protein
LARHPVYAHPQPAEAAREHAQLPLPAQLLRRELAAGDVLLRGLDEPPPVLRALVAQLLQVLHAALRLGHDLLCHGLCWVGQRVRRPSQQLAARGEPLGCRRRRWLPIASRGGGSSRGAVHGRAVG